MNQFANVYKFSPFYALWQLPGITISEISINDHEVILKAKIKSHYATCPICGKKSKRIHSVYYRNLQDLPISMNSVKIKLQTRKFYCCNAKCHRKIFSEQLSPYFFPYSRRMTRVNDHITKLSLEISARKSSYISKLMNFPVSPSTCLRLVYRCNIPSHRDVRHIGIDDWAYRKGHSYGTIVVDRETGKAIDLIKSRDNIDIISWLREHPNIESVTRDRASCYSKSVYLTHPQALQIADRFHIVKNYSDYIYKIVQKLLPEFKRLDNRQVAFPLDEKLKNGIQRITDLAMHGCKIPNQKQNIVLKAKELYREGHSKNEVAKILNMNIRTAIKYIENATNQINTGRISQNNYSSFLNDIIAGYCNDEKLSVVYRKIKKKGFNGCQRALSVRFGEIFKAGKKRNGDFAIKKLRCNCLPQTISPRKLTIYLTNRGYPKILSSSEIYSFKQIRDMNSKVQKLWDLSHEFRSVFEEKSVLKLKDWICHVGKSSFRELKGFVKGLISDLAAVTAAVKYDCNNGLTEGNVNRLKNIKRQMYGRANHALLRRKVVLSNTG